MHDLFNDWVGVMILITLLVCGYSFASDRMKKSSIYGYIKREIWIYRNITKKGR